MLIAILLTLLLSLSVLRHILEPACPACAGKEWRDDSAALACRGCGWSNAAAVKAPESAQYELIPGSR